MHKHKQRRLAGISRQRWRLLLLLLPLLRLLLRRQRRRHCWRRRFCQCKRNPQTDSETDGRTDGRADARKRQA